MAYICKVINLSRSFIFLSFSSSIQFFHIFYFYFTISRKSCFKFHSRYEEKKNVIQVHSFVKMKIFVGSRTKMCFKSYLFRDCSQGCGLGQRIKRCLHSFTALVCCVWKSRNPYFSSLYPISRLECAVG